MMTFIMMIMMLGVVASMKPDTTSPLVWLPQNTYVDSGEAIYDITAVFLNPCHDLKRLVETTASQTSSYSAAST